jgi:hypothetical protein
MSATVFGGEVKYTKRYRLGQLLSTLTRHFLLMTATPHNGKEEDFQLFMALLDGDRFEGKFRDGVHAGGRVRPDAAHGQGDLLKFDGTPLFPERIAYTVPYKLSDAEARLYKGGHRLRARGVQPRRGAGRTTSRRAPSAFALTILQRRLASSPEAIYQSLRRRRERLERTLRELDCCSAEPQVRPFKRAGLLDCRRRRGPGGSARQRGRAGRGEILDQATAARSIAELKAEIATLKRLESLARGAAQRQDTQVARTVAGCSARSSPRGWHWEPGRDPADLRRGRSRARHVPSPRQKLVIFTEHRDTLNYLEQRSPPCSAAKAVVR